MQEVTIHDGVTVPVDHPHAQTSGYVQIGTAVPQPATTITTTANPGSGITIDMKGQQVEPLWWMRRVPVMQSELYLAGTDTMIIALETPVPNLFRRLIARLAGFEWRSCR